MHEESDAGGAGKLLLTLLIPDEVQDKNADLSKLLTEFVIRWRLMDVLILSRVRLLSPLALTAFEALDETTEKTFAV
jgi:hypothetical protein